MIDLLSILNILVVLGMVVTLMLANCRTVTATVAVRVMPARW